MSSGSNQPQNIVTTQNKDPWSGSQPFLTEALENARGMFQSGTGYLPWTGATQADMDPALSQGLALGSGLSQANALGTPNVLAAQGLAGSMIGSQGMTPGIENALNSSTGLGQGLNQYYNMYNEAAGQQNPYLQSVIAANDRRIKDQVGSVMGGAGRYGSGAHQDLLARSLAEAANPILAQDYSQRQQTRLQALQGAGASNQAMADIVGQGLNRAGQWSQLAPSLDQAQYAPSQMLMSLGDYMTQRNQAGLQSAIQNYNVQQARPWEQLARYNAIATGTGGLGGSQTTVAPNVNAPVSGLQRGLGGALAGAAFGSAVPGIGTGLGALGGGLMGLL